MSSLKPRDSKGPISVTGNFWALHDQYYDPGRNYMLQSFMVVILQCHQFLVGAFALMFKRFTIILLHELHLVSGCGVMWLSQDVSNLTGSASWTTVAGMQLQSYKKGSSPQSSVVSQNNWVELHKELPWSWSAVFWVEQWPCFCASSCKCHVFSVKKPPSPTHLKTLLHGWCSLSARKRTKAALRSMWGSGRWRIWPENILLGLKAWVCVYKKS